MKILGAILAGGRSRRFGMDKALVPIGGKPMIQAAIDALLPQVDWVVVCGRDWPGSVMIEDDPPGGLGPLAGLNAALGHAAGIGADAVVAIPIDVHPLPPDLVERLAGEGPAVFEEQYAIGFWPLACSGALAAYLDGGGRSIRGWIEEADARRVPEPGPMRNLNRPDDLEG